MEQQATETAPDEDVDEASHTTPVEADVSTSVLEELEVEANLEIEIPENGLSQKAV